MKRFAIIIACILLFISGVLWRAPAWLATDIARDRLDGVELGVATGSVWRGELSHIGFQGMVLRGLQWQLSPLRILGESPLVISLAEPAVVELAIGLDGEMLRVSSLTAKGRVGPLLEALQIPAMGFDGVFSGDIPSATWNAQGCQALEGEVSVAQLSGDIDGLASVGRVRAKVSCNAGTLRIVIDETNPVRLRGTITMNNRGIPRGQISLSPPPQSDIYRSLTQMFGRPSNGKDFTLRL